MEYSSLGHEKPSIQPPSVRLSTDKLAYRPGDTLLATVEVLRDDKNCCSSASNLIAEPILLENLIVEVKGIEKLDPQWLLTLDSVRDSKQRRGMYIYYMLILYARIMYSMDVSICILLHYDCVCDNCGQCSFVGQSHPIECKKEDQMRIKICLTSSVSNESNTELCNLMHS